MVIDEKNGHYIKPDLKTKETNYLTTELDQENDIILYRDLPTRNTKRRWGDLIKELELKNFTIINPMECYDICASKYLTDVFLKEHNLRTPKTTYITHISDSERAFNSLNTKFPVVLKASAGSQTGIGVVILESMRSLDATVQMCQYIDVPMVVQEYIKIDYVLGDFTAENHETMEERIDMSVKIIQSFTTAGIGRTMSDFNGK